MHLRIEMLAEKLLVGNRNKMSFSNDKTKELWQRLMPRRKEIPNAVGSALFSIEVYPPLFFNSFDSTVEFEKWAALEVSNVDHVPAGMETLLLPTGLYAVFRHYGPASEGSKTYQYIFETWLPHADFLLDDRPHFALMGARYKNDDPQSEEEIWIPVRPKRKAGD